MCSNRILYKLHKLHFRLTWLNLVTTTFCWWNRRMESVCPFTTASAALGEKRRETLNSTSIHTLDRSLSNRKKNRKHLAYSSHLFARLVVKTYTTCCWGWGSSAFRPEPIPHPTTGALTSDMVPAEGPCIAPASPRSPGGHSDFVTHSDSRLSWRHRF